MLETPTCMRCEHPLKVYGEYGEEGDGFKNIVYICENCGAIHSYYECNDDSKEDYEYWKDPENAEIYTTHSGYDGYCPNCGSNIIWGSDFMRSEVWGDVFYEDNDSLASSVHCPCCGGSIDIIDCRPSDYHKYPIYKNKADDSNT